MTSLSSSCVPVFAVQHFVCTQVPTIIVEPVLEWTKRSPGTVSHSNDDTLTVLFIHYNNIRPPGFNHSVNSYVNYTISLFNTLSCSSNTKNNNY